MRVQDPILDWQDNTRIDQDRLGIAVNKLQINDTLKLLFCKLNLGFLGCFLHKFVVINHEAILWETFFLFFRTH